MAILWTDSHCHLTMEAFADDLESVLDRARDADVGPILCVGTRPEDWGATTELAVRRGFLATAGLHPHEASRFDEKLLALLRHALGCPEVVAVGEVGLDYHYDFAPREEQLRAFESQAALAVELGLPLVVHSRLAFEDTVAVLRGTGGKVGGVLHCFAYGPVEAEAFVELGYHISFSGLVTFPKAPEILAAARTVPLGRLLIETDGPYLAPVPHRGKRCEPAHVAVTGRFLAERRSISPEEIAAATTANALALFGRK